MSRVRPRSETSNLRATTCCTIMPRSFAAKSDEFDEISVPPQTTGFARRPFAGDLRQKYVERLSAWRQQLISRITGKATNGQPAGTRKPSTGAPGAIRTELGQSLICELETLCQPRTWLGVRDVLTDLVAIAAAIAMGILAGGIIVPILTVLYIGVRQRYLANLTHECAHLKLVRPKWLNRALGHFVATILGESFVDYQEDHRIHHAKLGRNADPKLQSYAAKKATTPSRDKREFILRVVLANAVWALPKSTVMDWFAKPVREAWSTIIFRATFWLAIIALTVAANVFVAFLWYWVVPLTFVRPVINWVTDLGNHAGVIDDDDPIRQTRGWTSHALTRHMLGGHSDDMYHPIHHWCPKIPWRNLPEAAELVRQSYPRWTEVPWCSGFFFRGRSTPDVPCVVDDIVMRLRRVEQASSGGYSTVTVF